MPEIKSKQEAIVLIIFLWDGNAIGIRKPIGINGMILPRIFLKAMPKLKSLVYAKIVLKRNQVYAVPLHST